MEASTTERLTVEIQQTADSISRVLLRRPWETVVVHINVPRVFVCFRPPVMVFDPFLQNQSPSSCVELSCPTT